MGGTGGTIGILDGTPNPSSWNFRSAGPGGRYQVAGVSGINFTYFFMEKMKKVILKQDSLMLH